MGLKTHACPKVIYDMTYGNVPNGTRDQETPSIFKLGQGLVLEDTTTLLHDGGHGIFLKLPRVREHFLKKLCIRGHLLNDIRKWDIDL